MTSLSLVSNEEEERYPLWKMVYRTRVQEYLVAFRCPISYCALSEVTESATALPANSFEQ